MRLFRHRDRHRARQIATVADEIVELAQKSGFSPLASSGYEGETWILVDCVDVVFHVFNAQARNYYDLDNLWGDARAWNGCPKRPRQRLGNLTMRQTAGSA